MDWYEVLAQIAVNECAGARIDNGLLEQGHPNSEGHAANQLGTRRFAIQNVARRKNPKHAPKTDLSRIGVHPDFGKVSTKRVDGVARIVGVGPHSSALPLHFKAIGIITCNQVEDGSS